MIIAELESVFFVERGLSLPLLGLPLSLLGLTSYCFERQKIVRILKIDHMENI